MPSRQERLQPPGGRRLCVFCGERPVDKNREHVVPRWLLELTGGESREAVFGPVWNETEGRLDTLKIPFSAFAFPACRECNEVFSTLEGQARDVVARMLRKLAVQASDLSVLMSWLDKVRTGLWLAFYFLQRNLAGIDPHMAIADRIDRSDRLVYIFRAQESTPGVHILGANTPAFQYLPVCFAIIINDLGLFNASTDFLFSRRLGLPYSARAEWDTWPSVAYEVAAPRERVLLPLLRGPWDTECTRLYQPMAGRPEIRTILESFGDSQSVRRCFGDATSGKGVVLLETVRQLEPFPDNPTDVWIPPAPHDKSGLAKLLFRKCTKLQLQLMREGPGLKGLPEERKHIVKEQHRLANYVGRRMLDELV